MFDNLDRWLLHLECILRAAAYFELKWPMMLEFEASCENSSELCYFDCCTVPDWHETVQSSKHLPSSKTKTSVLYCLWASSMISYLRALKFEPEYLAASVVVWRSVDLV